MDAQLCQQSPPTSAAKVNKTSLVTLYLLETHIRIDMSHASPHAGNLGTTAPSVGHLVRRPERNSQHRLIFCIFTWSRKQQDSPRFSSSSTAYSSPHFVTSQVHHSCIPLGLGDRTLLTPTNHGAHPRCNLTSEMTRAKLSTLGITSPKAILQYSQFNPQDY